MRIFLAFICIVTMTIAISGCDKEDSQTATVAETDTAVELVPVQELETTPPAAAVAQAPADPDAVVVTVNGEAITEGAVFEEFNKRKEAMKKQGRELPPQQESQMRMGIVDMLTQKTVLTQELAKKNITVSDEKVMEEITKMAGQKNQTLDEVKAEIAQYGMTIDDLISQVRPQIEMQELAKVYAEDPEMQAEAKTFYDENPSYFQMPEQVKASHILLGKRGITPEEKPEYLAKITEIEAKLKAGENFEELAKENSTCPSKDKGGDLGFFGKGQMDPAFEKAAFEMEVGQTSGIVESSFGYHIIKVTDKKEASSKSLEEVQEQIIAYLLQKKMKEGSKIEYSEAEQARQEQAKQQQQMQQQMMQQMMQQQAQQKAEKVAGEKTVEAVTEDVKEKAVEAIEAVKEEVKKPAEK